LGIAMDQFEQKFVTDTVAGSIAAKAEMGEEV
jgi:hypothetical protein